MTCRTRCCATVISCWTVVMITSPALATTVCAGTSTLEGIDVSSYQGAVDWQAVAASKAFAFTRVSDGTGFIDPDYSRNYFGIRAAGLARGVYQFFEPTQDAVAQANLLLQKIRAPLEQGDLPPALDVEITGGQSASTIAAKIQTWATTVQDAIGKPPIIFIGAYFWNSSVQSSGLANNPLWIVDWSHSCPTLPAAWNGWLFWNHSDTGTVDGVSGPVDLDTFNGSSLQLQALVENERLFADGFDPL